ncbi:hypothetical protein D4764_11G0006140 [Takifugu flavidus]|uniref:Uncharacterized protein n=1 Tax=Takifugu flavidus TaxID=433684 RepID=A0A5C6PG58_9TELE|nr:hypothetical protein D4764_11G0006140 [Takifugu flavidus]
MLVTSLHVSSYMGSGSVRSSVREQKRPQGSSLRSLLCLSLEPLDHHRRTCRTARPNQSAMTRMVVGGMPDTAVAGAGEAGMMLNRRRSKARRRKRKELFGFQMCFAGILLGLVAGLRSVSQTAARPSTSLLLENCKERTEREGGEAQMEYFEVAKPQ